MKELEKKQIEEMIDKAINMMDYSYGKERNRLWRLQY